eukprot:TRINITY_DN7080_c0_g1_i1.p1 TRINITY_DN7080_c0_g1~~TRINITY_DN7080_c0_g1_i1.p1  ORF type:complete len:633 (+),score=120.02 TRINITY_DN7080_c0_g1_i1:122-2020(+)
METASSYSGLTGLTNCGNTCFLSSVIQVLSNCEAFREFMFNCPGIINECPEDSLARPLHAVLQELWSGEFLYASPRSLVSAVKRKNESFQGYRQQDAQDFWLFLLDTLDEELKQPASGPVPLCLSLFEDINDPTTIRRGPSQQHQRLRPTHSIVTDLFQGKLLSEITCSSCGNTSITQEPFYDLSLEVAGSDTVASSWADMFSMLKPFTGSTSLARCLKDFFSQEQLVDEDQYHCDKCQGKRDATKQLRIGRIPEVLCFTLKRFKAIGNSFVKIQTHVDFGESVDVLQYCTDDEQARLPQDASYDLMGVVIHEGSVNSGHYTACAQRDNDREWYLFNDTEVLDTTVTNVQASQAYMLMYKRVSPSSAAQMQAIFDESFESRPEQNISISRAWLSLAANTTLPSAINNWDIMCAHGGFQVAKSARADDYIVKVHASTYHQLAKAFGAGSTIIRDSPCHICRRALAAVGQRCSEEMDIIMALHDRWSIEDERHCLLSARWFKQWEAFVNARDGEHPLPPPINNQTLLTSDRRHLRPRLQEQRDYFFVNYEIFQQFQDWYGGGPGVVAEYKQDLELVVVADTIDPAMLQAQPDPDLQASMQPDEQRQDGDGAQTATANDHDDNKHTRKMDINHDA